MGLLSSLQAGDVIKLDNTTNLNLGASWDTTIAPTSSDVAVWAGTYNAAGSLASTFTASTPVSWGGLRIGNVTGTAATGLISIGGTVGAATGSSITLGSSGIDMSLATQNLVINSATTILTGSTQTWNVATGRNLRFGITGTGGANANLDGTAGTVVTVEGGGLVDLNQGGASGFSDAAGYAGFNGKWIIGANTTLRGLRHGATAWGTNTDADAIKLNGGTLAVGGISGAVGNWAWTTNITVAAASTIDNQNISGAARWLKLSGVLTGSADLTFASTGAGTMSADAGFILTNTNTLSGKITINSGVFVRVGAVGGNDLTTTVGSTGTLGTSDIVNNGTLTLSRDNTWTFANNVSGTGILRIGITTGSATHIATVSGNNTHSGGTTLQSAVTLKIGSTNALGTGTFTIAGGGNFDNATGSALTLSNAISLTGGSPTFLGTDDLTFNGAGLVSGANRTITVDAKTLTLGGNIAEDTAGRGLTKAGAGTLVLSGTNGYTGLTTVNGGTLTVSGGAAIADSSNVVLANSAGVTLKLNSSETIAGLSGGGTTGGTVNINGQTLTVTPPGAQSDFNGALTGSGTVVKAGANQLRLGGTNTFSGTHQIDAGLVIFTSTGSDNGLPNVIMNGDANSGLVIGDVFAGGELTIGSLSGTGGKVRVDWNAAPGQRTLSVTQAVDTTFAGTLEDFTAGRIVGLKKSGIGVLTLTTSQPYTGTTNITGGTLALSGSGALSNSAAVSLTASGTVFDISGITGPTTEKIGSLSAASGSMVHLGGNTLEFGDATNTSFSGVADGTGGGLKKVGSGTLTLNGTTTNTYTGTTSLVGGTLLLGNNDVLPNAAPFSLSDGTTFSTGGFNETTGSFSLAGNAVIDLVGGTSVLTFSNIDSWSGVLSVWNWNGTLNTAGGPGNTRLIFSAGSLTSEQLSNVHFYSGGSGSQEVGSGGVFIGNELVAVPEPTSLSASAMLVAWMLCGGRRRTKV